MEGKCIRKSNICDDCGCVMEVENQLHNFIYGTTELSTVIPVWVCGLCGEAYMGEEAETLKHEEICESLGVLSPREIVGIRNVFGWSRLQLAEKIGVSEEDVRKWEMALRIQNKEEDQLLRELWI